MIETGSIERPHAIEGNLVLPEHSGGPVVLANQFSHTPFHRRIHGYFFLG